MIWKNCPADWELTASVQSLAQSVEQMAQSQSRQETRTGGVGKPRPGEMWRKVVGYVLTAVISVTVGFIFLRLACKGGNEYV